MSAVFLLDQVLACTECAKSEYSTMSQCLSALLGRPGRIKFILNGLRWKKNHGSKPLTRSKISEISQWQKCFSDVKISNPRISCTLNGVRRSSCKVVRVTKSNYASETSFKWQIFCSCSWQAIDTCWQDKFDIKIMSWKILFISQIFWYCFLILQHSFMHSIVACQLRE